MCNNTNFIQKAFSAIEMLIFIMIVSVLAAVAVPAFSGATPKTEVASWLQQAEEAKISITEHYNNRKNLFINIPKVVYHTADPGQAGVLKSVEVKRGKIEMVGAIRFEGKPEEVVLILEPNIQDKQIINFKCSAQTMRDELVPNECTKI